ncbi:CHAT domain-containing protein [Kamptonema sp. UHCC 0994]|uniref:CHAT domain-containing protein n=1 Tax=Kamptonema sp. UHCC 0994 TaxID=3031329 RepID=UPI0023B8A1F5|nr:CHAT domain-containing protein [Kamptonema sp. UHCC 0994]MDF0555605.1 CHAT domain-containing protein [Kamptonema sp. UHCC 0994]
MKPEVARRRIEAFERRFGITHLIFACHGAFPLALTPDLLYKLWANFQRDIHGKVLGIPWVAVADLLLSSLCDEVGRELYEMDTAVRNSLLNRLKENENFGQLRINELSDFLLFYVRQQLQSNDQEVRDFAQAQRWTALAYLRPNEAAQELRSALEQTYQQDKSEQLRLVSLVETFAEPLAEFEPLLVYAREIGKFKRSDSAIAATGVSQELGQSSQVKTDDFSKEVLDGINPPSNKEPRENNFVRIQTVILTIGDGDFERGFPVIAQIWLGNERFPTQLQVTLPPTDVYSSYCNWQSYYQVCNEFSHRGLVRVEGYSNMSFTELRQLAQALQNSINNWLNSESFRPLVDLLYRQLSSTDKIQVLIVTKNPLLQRLPWDLWEFFEYYPKADLAFGFLSTKIKQSTHSRNKVRIFALLGTGINVDLDISLIDQLPNTESVFLVESSRERLNDQLWDEQGWDIFYFGGLSSSDSDDNNGEIRLNSTDVLTAEELKFSLKRAVERGLKLAIFNSCDGLGIANKLADLGNLTIIVMRDQLTNKVAEEFLKHFLSAFSSGQSLYASVREVRERLQGLEDRYPCASWLPVIFQNPAEEPPTWQGFLNQGVDNNKAVNLNQLSQGAIPDGWQAIRGETRFFFSDPPR